MTPDTPLSSGHPQRKRRSRKKRAKPEAVELAEVTGTTTGPHHPTYTRIAFGPSGHILVTETLPLLTEPAPLPPTRFQRFRTRLADRLTTLAHWVRP